jgi:non-ribosomal peptide synthase protein (TIGR01720 family)
LLQDVPAVFATRINDVLLTAVAAAVGSWTGADHVRLDLEGHGREDLFEDLDLSRTTGWFTTISPVRLAVARSGSLVAGLKATKELLRARPRQGIGYGLLLDGGDEVLRAAEPAQISFNYLGQFDGGFGGGFAAGSGLAGPDWDPDNARAYLVDIVGWVQDGELHLEWTYCPDLHDQDTVVRVAEDVLTHLRALVRAARAPRTQGYSPSDFPSAGLSQPQIDALVDAVRPSRAWQDSASLRPLQDCYPQTPIQQGLWFQSEFARGEGVYHVQMVFDLDQPLDVEVFRRAWSQTMRRHPILRTSFHTLGDRALQLVWADDQPPLQEQDWRTGDPQDQDRRLREHLDRDRQCGFDPADAPQWRLLLARTGDQTFTLVWSAHHAVLDGWSISIILDDVTRCYTALVNNTTPDLPPVPPYRHYVDWLARQDMTQAETYWRDHLTGFDQPTPLPTELGETATRRPDTVPRREQVLDLSSEDSARMVRLAQQHGLTLNTVLQGAWALLLSRYTGADDVVFGTVVSGRAADVEGIDTIAGLFINTLPVRVQLPPDRTTLAWLTELQHRSTRSRQHEHTPLNRIQQWSDLPPGTALFTTLFVFENYPTGGVTDAALRLRMARSVERVDFPLGLVVLGQDPLRIVLQHDTTTFDDAAAQRLLACFANVCSQLAQDPEQPLGDVSLLTQEQRVEVLARGRSAPPRPSSEIDVPDDLDSSVDLDELFASALGGEDRELLLSLIAEVQREQDDHRSTEEQAHHD